MGLGYGFDYMWFGSQSSGFGLRRVCGELRSHEVWAVLWAWVALGSGFD